MKVLRRIVVWVGIGLMLATIFTCGAAPVQTRRTDGGVQLLS